MSKLDLLQLQLYLAQLMFLEKYKNKRRLGKGAYGDVYLVEDNKGTEYALKLMSVKMIEDEPHLRQYLEGEIQCMKTMNSTYIIKLYDVQQDEKFVHLLLQYCDGGDLVNYQAKLKDMVFPIEKATQVLAEVIIGLEQLHKEGYLHRDIKPQNVLIKTENGKEVYKLADFGFSKKKTDIGGTILGTDPFMSPQIFEGNEAQTYGFQVDMWAFGVLFYFMLNMEFPFKMNPHWQPERKQTELKKQAANFSYAALVKNTKKKKTENCTPQIENLFKCMFDLDSDRRITFSDIRKHALFAQYFPVVKEASKILYSKKFQSKMYKKQDKKKVPQKKIIEQEDNIPQTISVVIPNHKKFPVQMQTLQRKKDEIDFLRDNAEVFMDSGEILKGHQKLMISYNLLKYYIVLLRKFKLGLNKNSLNDRYPNLKWNEYTATKEFKDLVKQVNDDLGQNQLKFTNLYDQCQDYLKEISGINLKFKNAFDREIEEKEFDGEFKESYRKSTIYIFGVLREILKSKSKKGNKLNYILSLLVISHAFNNIFSDLDSLGIIFKQYLDEKKKTVDKIDYNDLRNWMSSSKQTVLNNIAKSIIKIYFAS